MRLVLHQWFLAGVVVALGARGDPEVLPSPVIAVLAQPLDSGAPGSYLEAWYVKWLEAHGARVAPLRYDAPAQDREWLLSRVNGVLFPGGSAGIGEHSEYGRFSAEVFRQAVAARLPLWGTCLGFEQAMLYSSGEPHPGPVSKHWDADPLFAPLELLPGAENSTLLAGWPEALRRHAAAEPWTWHKHKRGVSTKAFAERPVLGGFWRVLATNRDLQGREFVSLVEARDLPIFASQFHPEKNVFEFELAETPVSGRLPAHSAGAIDAMSRLAGSFVEVSRHSRSFGFSDDEFWKASTFAWPVRLAGQTAGLDWLPKHMQVYWFPPHGSVDAAAGAVPAVETLTV